VTALPTWLTPLLPAESMRAVDRWAIEQRGVPGVDLMERAGAAVARTVERIAPDGPVTVVSGKGNNGGDGLVVARLLREAGRTATVIDVKADGDAPPAIGGSVVVVDALLGTGFQGEPRGAVAQAIDAINAADAHVVSVDVPSGVDASTGAVAACAVLADTTVTFHAAKPGLWIRPGKAHTGVVEIVDIGIPRGAPEETAIGLIDSSVLDALPRREASSTKFSSGHVLVVGGSRGLTGAPTMTARASMRAGAGYVTACVPASLQAILASSGTPELMTVGLPDESGAMTAGGVGEVLRLAERGGALALGPGLGRSDGAVAFARTLARDAEIALVLDADGLGAHAGRLEELAGRRAPTVLTPHSGEMARLLELDGGGEEVERNRLRHARAAAERSAAVVVLKGDDTLVAAPDGRVAVSRGASPALATAGTGDVLTGVIAALLAQGVEPFAAAAAGVWLHARAGREAARRVESAEGVMASDVIDAITTARAYGYREQGEERGIDG
jgi:hydroxyethylthiazole kinase-like uncharacterized protein yjeF